jgi:2-keto-4-pentenoate hydratase/2-oxohepta-3-ene-1,7-dioic acid hydratase in catechol pathway
MRINRRSFVATMAVGGKAMAQATGRQVSRYVRYERSGAVSYGALEGDSVRPIEGGLFGSRRPTGQAIPLADVKLLYPCEPTKVLCVGLNYASHIGNRPKPTVPEMFYKPLTSLQHPLGEIVIPPDSKDLHFEGEFVIVMGATARRVSTAEAESAILGYTCGNDVSDRNWQSGSKGDVKDLQWWRAKGSDTFAPLGPAIAVGLDYAESRLQLRLNGEVKQSQVISDLIFGPPEIVSFVSRYVTLLPGDVIYTGTPGSTSAMKAGDVVEVEIDGIGVLRNHVAAG